MSEPINVTVHISAVGDTPHGARTSLQAYGVTLTDDPETNASLLKNLGRSVTFALGHLTAKHGSFLSGRTPED